MSGDQVLFRLLATVMAGGSAAAAYQISQLNRAHPELVAITGIGCLCFIAGVFAPTSWVRQFTQGIRRLRKTLESGPISVTRVKLFALYALATIIGIWTLRANWQQPTILEETDQGAYIATAQTIQEAGGISSFVSRLYSGEFVEANRHPFYLGCLSLWPTVVWGKLLSTGAVITAVLGTSIHLHRQGSTLAGGLVLLGSVLLPSLLKTSIMIGCEGWLMLWITMAWWLLDRRVPSMVCAQIADSNSVSEQISCDATKMTQPVKSSTSCVSIGLFLAGISLGFAWLTKGTALPLLPLTAIWLIGRQIVKRSPLRSTVLLTLLFFVGWLTVAHSLIIRNVRVYGSPFHNVNSWLFFVDAYEDPYTLSSQPISGVLQRYLQTHGIVDVISREANGLVWETFVVLRVLGFGDHQLTRVATGCLIGLLTVIGVSTSARTGAMLVLVWTPMMVLLFAWYIPIAADDRFVVPFVPIWMAYAAEATAALLTLRYRRQSQTPAIE